MPAPPSPPADRSAASRRCWVVSRRRARTPGSSWRARSEQHGRPSRSRSAGGFRPPRSGAVPHRRADVRRGRRPGPACRGRPGRTLRASAVGDHRARRRLLVQHPDERRGRRRFRPVRFGVRELSPAYRPAPRTPACRPASIVRGRLSGTSARRRARRTSRRCAPGRRDILGRRLFRRSRSRP